MPTMRMHLYTLVQLTGLAVLYAVKSSRISLALPFFLVMMVPLRMALGYVFTPLQLRAVRKVAVRSRRGAGAGAYKTLFYVSQLDGAQKDIEEDDEPDFYQEAPLPG